MRDAPSCRPLYLIHRPVLTRAMGSLVTLSYLIKAKFRRKWPLVSSLLVSLAIASFHFQLCNTSFHSELSQCDSTQCIHGSCNSNQCICDFGWQGPHCDQCGGRIRYHILTQFSKGNLTLLFLGSPLLPAVRLLTAWATTALIFSAPGWLTVESRMLLLDCSSTTLKRNALGTTCTFLTETQFLIHL